MPDLYTIPGLAWGHEGNEWSAAPWNGRQYYILSRDGETFQFGIHTLATNEFGSQQTWYDTPQAAKAAADAHYREQVAALLLPVRPGTAAERLALAVLAGHADAVGPLIDAASEEHRHEPGEPPWLVMGPNPPTAPGRYWARIDEQPAEVYSVGQRAGFPFAGNGMQCDGRRGSFTTLLMNVEWGQHPVPEPRHPSAPPA